MKDQYKKILDDMAIIKSFIHYIDGRRLLGYLHIHKVITFNDKVKIDQLGPKDSFEYLITTYLQGIDDKHMQTFIDSLDEAHYQDACDWLKNKVANASNSTKSEPQDGNQGTSSSGNVVDINEEAIKKNELFYSEILPLCKDVPETDGYIDDFTIDGADGSFPTNINMKKVYRNLSDPKGLALIINNKNFTRSPTRLGTDVDEANMEKLLEKLNYKVEIRKDLTAAEIMTTMKDFAKRKEHISCDSTVVVILTHGNRFGDLIGRDEGKVSVDQFIGTLNRNGCPALVKKPKIFFIQACRGKNHDRGYNTTDSEENSSGDEVDAVLEKTPEDADMFIAFSTTPGYVSWRNKRTGTWFIQAICQCILSYGKEKHILEIFTEVHDVVSSKLIHIKKICAADCKGNCNGNCKRVQMAESKYRLTKLFYFFPGI